MNDSSNLPPVINQLLPDAYSNFAKACAALAKSHGVSSFMLKITPKWRDPVPTGIQINGDIQINYSATDGRGRPSEELSVYLTTNTRISVVSEPKSFG